LKKGIYRNKSSLRASWVQPPHYEGALRTAGRESTRRTAPI
jgi:hypothetical protein